MAHRPKVESLDERDWKALELFKSGESNVSEVARQVGMDVSNLHSLIKGDVEKMGNKASVFQREYFKLVDKEIAQSQKRVSKLAANCEELAYTIYKREMENYSQKDHLTDSDKKIVATMTKAMSTLKPAGPRSVKLSQTWNYVKGLTPQELEHEFSRLRGLAEGASDAGRVQTPE